MRDFASSTKIDHADDHDTAHESVGKATAVDPELYDDREDRTAELGGWETLGGEADGATHERSAGRGDDSGGSGPRAYSAEKNPWPLIPESVQILMGRRARRVRNQMNNVARKARVAFLNPPDCLSPGWRPPGGRQQPEASPIRDPVLLMKQRAYRRWIQGEDYKVAWADERLKSARQALETLRTGTSGLATQRRRAQEAYDRALSSHRAANARLRAARARVR